MGKRFFLGIVLISGIFFAFSESTFAISDELNKRVERWLEIVDGFPKAQDVLLDDGDRIMEIKWEMDDILFKAYEEGEGDELKERFLNKKEYFDSVKRYLDLVNYETISKFLKDEIKLDDEEAIVTAEEEYKKFSDKQKKSITKEYKIIEDARKEIDKIKNRNNEMIDNYKKKKDTVDTSNESKEDDIKEVEVEKLDNTENENKESNENRVFILVGIIFIVGIIITSIIIYKKRRDKKLGYVTYKNNKWFK